MKTLEVINIATSNSVDFVFLQEPYLVKNKLYGIPIAWRALYASNDAKTAILITNKSVTCFPLILDPNFCLIKTTNLNKDWIFCNVYWEYYHNSLSHQLSYVKNCLRSFPSSYAIILGDFNAKSPLWGGGVKYVTPRVRKWKSSVSKTISIFAMIRIVFQRTRLVKIGLGLT